jgi:hypothetical protein
VKPSGPKIQLPPSSQFLKLIFGGYIKLLAIILYSHAVQTSAQIYISPSGIPRFEPSPIMAGTSPTKISFSYSYSGVSHSGFFSYEFVAKFYIVRSDGSGGEQSLGSSPIHEFVNPGVIGYSATTTVSTDSIKIPKSAIGDYYVVVRLAAGSSGNITFPRDNKATSAFLVHVTKYVPPDEVAPRVRITVPTSGERVLTNNGEWLIKGTASDNVGLEQVLVNLNGTGWQPASGTVSWQLMMPLLPGPNTLSAYAVDASGNRSPTTTVNFSYVVSSQLALLTNGQGRISRRFTGNTLEVGRSYTLTAVPASGQLFSNWVGTLTTTNNPLKYIMQPDMVLQANFVPNPFIPLKGKYSGLFMPYPTETINATNAGSITLSLTESGAFSGKALLLGKTHPFSGKFDLDCRATIKVARLGSSPLTIDLGFDAQFITGQITTTDWTGNALVVRRSTAASNAFAGRYSMLLMGHRDATDSPPGDSALAVTVNGPSSIRVSGMMADGAVVTLATGHSAEGMWPIYIPLYKGRGLVIGWINCQSNPAPQAVMWVKSADAARYYPTGFSVEQEVALGRYLAPAAKQTATTWTQGRLLIGGGDLPTSLEAEVLVTNSLLKTLSGSVSNLSLTITKSNGRFGGTFMHPVTRKTTPFKGVLLQGLHWVQSAEQVTVGGGSFLGSNQGGWLWLEPAKAFVSQPNN